MGSTGIALYIGAGRPLPRGRSQACHAVATMSQVSQDRPFAHLAVMAQKVSLRIFSFHLPLML